MESTPTIEHDEAIEQAVQLLPWEIREQVREFIESLLAERNAPSEARRPNLEWRGALRDLREQYTSVELQHKVIEWWGD
jgi:hypothetical protein